MDAEVLALEDVSFVLFLRALILLGNANQWQIIEVVYFFNIIFCLIGFLILQFIFGLRHKFPVVAKV